MLRQLCGARPLNMPVGQVQALLVGLGAGDPVVAARRCQAWSLRGGPPRAQDWLALCDAPGVEELQQPGPWPLAALPRLVLDAAQAEARFGPAAGWVAQAEPGPGFQQAVRRADELEWWETSFTLGSAPPQAQAAALRSAWSAGTRVLACRWPGLGTALPQTPRASDLCCADLLSHGDEDCRAWTWADRDARLRLLAQSAGLPVLPRWREDDWAALDRLRHQVVAQGGAGLRLIRSPAQAASAVAAAGASSGASADADASWVWPARVHQLPMLLVYAGEADDGSTTLTVALWNRRPRDAAEVAEVAQAISLRQAPAAGGFRPCQ